MTSRSGFSLLEILLALAILGGSMAILSQIAQTGTEASREARDLATARMISQSKLAELLINPTVTPQAVPPTPVESLAAEASSEFEYAVEVQQAPLEGILAIRVSVQAYAPGNRTQPLATYSLQRWIVDPALGLEQLQVEEEAASEEAAAASDSGAAI